MFDLWNTEWLNENEQRRFPLADSASAQDVTGTFTLPDSFLVELELPVPVGINPSDLDTTKFFLLKVTVLPSGYTVVIGYDNGTPDPLVVTRAIIPKAGLAEFDRFDLPGLGDFWDVAGTLVVGRTEEIDLQPAGEWTFSPESGRLDLDCIRPVPRGVSSVTLINGNDQSPKLTGDIVLAAGTNIELTQVGPRTIRIDAISGAGLTETCECTGDVSLPPPIRTINGLPPAPDGNFTFSGNQCVAITPISHGLLFADSCSSPCCGCPELEALTAELAHFGNEATTLQNFIARLAGQFNQFNAVVLASQLNDTPCP